MNLGLHGKVALVTAASKGLGRGAALALAQEGAKLVICARDPERLQATADEFPGEVLAVPADITDPAVPQQLVDAALERFGALDVLVANAGGPPQATAMEVTDDGMLAAVNDNMLSSIRLVQASVPHMRSGGWGRICLITSYTIKQPVANLAYSNAARTGLWAWAKTAAQDLVADGITLNLACPGLHRTDRMKGLGLSGPMGDPEDFGRVVTFLCSEPAGYVTGTALQVDGGAVVGLL
jgi:3-oxoacyl-[acyl-carrier protein] reductase